MRNFLLIALLMAFMIAVMSCSESTVRSNDTRANFSIRLATAGMLPKAAASSFTVTDQGGTTFIITEARANIRHIQFDLPEGESDSTNQISLDGPYVMDLMTGISSPQISEFDIQPGIYKRIDVRLDDTKAKDGLVAANDDLMDNTLVVKGTFDYDGNANRNFTFILKFNEDVRFEKPGGISIEDGASKDFILSLRVDEWLSDIDITDCLDNENAVLDGNGDLMIDDNNGNGDCNDFEKTIKSNIKNKYDLK